MALLTPESVFRRYEVPGVPDSGPHNIDKDEVIQLLISIIGSSNGAAVVKATVPLLNAVTPANENIGGMVLNDPDPSRNGYYYRSGGVWVWGRGLSDAFAELSITGGSADAIRASVGAGVSPSAATMLYFSPEGNNTGPATLNLNGAGALPIVDVNGAPLTAGKLTAGRVVMLSQSLGQYRMLSDPSGDGIVAAASAFADSAAADKLGAQQARNEAEYFAEMAALGNKGEDGDGFFRGFRFSRNATDPANDIDIAPGSARDLLNQSTIALAATITKRLDAVWALGTNQGGLDTGSVASGIWYHIHAIHNPTSGLTDVLFSTSQTSPVMPSGFTRRRWVGAITYVSGAIFPFLNDGDWLQFLTPANSYSSLALTQAPQLLTLAAPPGVKSEVDIYAIAFDPTAPDENKQQNAVVLRDPDLGAFTGSYALASLYYGKGQTYGGKLRVFTDTLGRVYGACGAPTPCSISVYVQAVHFDRQAYR